MLENLVTRCSTWSNIFNHMLTCYNSSSHVVSTCHNMWNMLGHLSHQLALQIQQFTGNELCNMIQHVINIAQHYVSNGWTSSITCYTWNNSFNHWTSNVYIVLGWATYLNSAFMMLIIDQPLIKSCFPWSNEAKYPGFDNKINPSPAKYQDYKSNSMESDQIP